MGLVLQIVALVPKLVLAQLLDNLLEAVQHVHHLVKVLIVEINHVEQIAYYLLMNMMDLALVCQMNLGKIVDLENS
jgi:hypothetical protein